MSCVAELVSEHAEAVSESGCWIWTRALSGAGYGQARVDGRTQYMHRLAYEEYVGPIPDGLFVLHRCDVRCCCNPDHLFAGTTQDNTADMVKKGRNTRGSECKTAKLNESDVVRIRERYNSGERVVDISQDYPVHIRNIYAAIRGEWWGHVK